MAQVKTLERILQTSLRLFNEFGEPKVTTNHIADEMDISPGNLYYHFRSKDAIIMALFQRYEQRMDEVLAVPAGRRLDMEDLWFFLHLVFETISEYRFLYRDLDNLISRNERLHLRIRRIVQHGIDTGVRLCEGLVESGVMRASPDEIRALATNVVITATYWLNFQALCRHPGGDGEAGGDLAAGVYQVITLASPFLGDDERRMLHHIAAQYVG